MLPDIGGSELLVLAIVALIVVGPKDLPVLLRKIGQFIGKMRGMASEFRASFDEMARQSELDELRKEVQAMRSGQYLQPFKDAAEAARDVGLNDTFAEIDASLNSGAIQPYPPAAAPEAPALEAPALDAPKPRPRAKAKPKAAPEPAIEIKPAKAPAKRASASKADEISAPPPKKPRASRKSDIIS
jgi:sec-independent protein translocase protein TatB